MEDGKKRKRKTKQTEPQETDTRDFPDEVLLNIFQFLRAKELCVLSRVSQHWKGLVELDELWMELYRKAWPESPLTKQSDVKDVKAKFAQRIRRTLPKGTQPPPLRLPMGYPFGASGPEALQILVVGSSGIGKSSMLVSYVTNAFPAEHIPTTDPHNYAAWVMVSGRAVCLSLWEMPENDISPEIKQKIYQKADVIIYGFSITDFESFWAVDEVWRPEVEKYRPGIGCVLAAFKEDMRQELDTIASTTVEEGIDMCTKINAKGYLECSALTQRGLKAVFDDTIRLGLLQKLGSFKMKKHKKCIVQ